ncbi:MAG: hypothetical protein ABJB47_01575 [Actinomycetota bacterium]
MLNSAAGPLRPPLHPPHQPTDSELLQTIRHRAPDFTVRKSTDGSIWIAVETPIPPQHRIYAGHCLLDLARNILGIDVL